MMKQTILLAIIGSILIAATTIDLTKDDEQPSEEYDNLTVHVIDIGQGGAILIECPDGKHQMIIDSGELDFNDNISGHYFRNYIKSFTKLGDLIEVVISTQSEANHIAGLQWLIDNYRIGLYVDNGLDDNQDTSDKGLKDTLNEALLYKTKSKRSFPSIDFCKRSDVTAEILSPYVTRDGNMSLVVRVQYGESSFLFAGNTDSAMKKALLDDRETQALLDVDWLKTNLSGEATEIDRFLNAVTPKVAVISTSKLNDEEPTAISYEKLKDYTTDRPSAPVNQRYYDQSAKNWMDIVTQESIYSSMTEGNLIFSSDGLDIECLTVLYENVHGEQEDDGN